MLQDLGTSIDRLDSLECRLRTVEHDVVVDLEEPALGFFGPDLAAEVLVGQRHVFCPRRRQ
jgi:hypothetical protein